MKSLSFAVSTTAIQIVAADNLNRQIYVHPIGNGVVYIGGSDVTAANGMLTEKGAVPFAMNLPSGESLWAITAMGTEDIRVLTPNQD